jgi:hypothetical protein
MDWRAYVSLIVAILIIGSYAPYLLEIFGWDIFFRKIPKRSPSLPAWIIFFSLSLIVWLGMYTKQTLTAQAYASVVGGFVILMIAFFRGNPVWKVRHFFCLIGAFAGIWIWRIVGDANAGIVIACSVSLLAVFAMAPELWDKPHHESRLSWSMAWVGCVLQLIALQSFTISSATQAVFAFVGDSIIVAILYARTHPLSRFKKKD